MGTLQPVNFPIAFSFAWSALVGAKLAENLFLVFEIALASTACYLLVRRYVRSQVAAIVASVVYVVNPVFLLQFIIGPFVLMAYALLPLVLLTFLKFMDGRSLRSLILFMITFAIPNYFDPFAFLYELLLIGSYLVCMTIVGRNWKSLPYNVLAMVLALGGALLILLPVYSIDLFDYVGLTSTGYILVPSTALQNIPFEYAGATFTNLFRLLADPSSVVSLYLNSYSLTGLAGFVLPVGAVAALFSRTNKSTNSFMYATGAILVLAMGTILLIKSELVPAVSILAVFQDPERLMFILAFAFCILLAISLDAASSRLSRASQSTTLRKVLPGLGYVFLIGFLLISTIVFNAGAFNGSDGLFRVYPESTVTLSPQYAAALSWVDSRLSNESAFRTLWLPTDSYTFQAITPSDPYIFASWAGGEQFGWPNINLTNTIFGMISGNSTDQIGSLLAPFAVRYVVVPNDTSLNGQQMHLVDLFITSMGIEGSQSAFMAFLNKQEDLKLVYSSDDFTVYENLDFLPHLSEFHSSLLIVDNKTDPLGGIENLDGFPGFAAGNQLTILSQNVPSGQMESVMQDVNYTLYVNPQEVTTNSAPSSQIFDFTTTNGSSMSIPISGGTNAPAYIAIATNSTSIQASTPAGTIALIPNPGGTNDTGWYYGTLATGLGNTTLHVVARDGGQIDQLFVIEPGAIKVLPVPSSIITQSSGSDSDSGCTWTYLSESYSASWSENNALLHVEGFGYGNAFCGTGSLTVFNDLQGPYQVLILISALTISALVGIYAVATMREKKLVSRVEL